MRQNVAIIFSLFFVLMLALWGQYVLSPENFSEHFSSVLYQVVMLFVLEGDWTVSIALPWQLELARILAPLVSVAGVLIILIRGAWVSMTNLFTRLWNDHVIVVGLGDKGWQFAQSSKLEHKTIVVERDENNSFIERARERGIVVIVGDILEDQVMSAANLEKARHLVTFCGNDGVSVEIAIRAREYLRRFIDTSTHRLRIHLHVNATRVSSRLENYSKFYDDYKVAEVDFFSVHDLTARLLLKKYPPDPFADAFGQCQVHIALYSFGTLAEQILTEAVRICHYLNGSKVRFTIFDADAERKIQTTLSLHPGLPQLCEIHAIDLAYLYPLQLEAVPDHLLHSVTEHVICLPDDDQNLEVALMLRSILLMRPGCNAPINVRMQHSSGLARLLESSKGEPEIPDGLYPFGMLDEVLYHDNIISDSLDKLAQAIHEDYLTRRDPTDIDVRLYSSLSEWGELPQPERKSSRLQADHLDAKLRAVRCHASEGPPNDFSFTREEAESLARMEHARWQASKIYEGWREGSERIEGAKITPFAVPWGDMEESEREGEIGSIMRLPEILHSRLGWRIEREFYVGVTGHRPHRADLTDSTLLDSIDSTLGEIAREHQEKRLILVSPLAEGADRVVARIALEQYGMALHVPLPLPFELYQTDFQTKASLNEFKALVGRAETYFELPTKFGSVETLASHLDGTPNEARNKQYALVGAYIAQICDEMIAIYDGGPANGTGGTAQIVSWRAANGLPDEFLNRSDFFVRPVMSEPIVIRVQQPPQR